MIFEKRGDIFIGKFPRLFNRPDIIHGLSTRLGGVSEPPYNSLNLGNSTDDLSTNVDTNLRHFFSAMGIDTGNTCIPEQIHSNKVKNVSIPGSYARTDGLVTATPNLFLLIQVADCMPVFLFDPITSSVGLIHAGWRGCADKIVTSAVTLMIQNFGTDINNLQIFVGPSIGSCCYEVGEEFLSVFSENYIKNSHLNLSKILKHELRELQIPDINIYFSNLCTACQTQYFYSHRRAKGRTGRLMGVIGIAEN